MHLFLEIINLLARSTISSFHICGKDDKLIKIGDSHIPFSILKKRCKLIQNMFGDLSVTDVDEIPYNDMFKNIDIYIKYIKTNEIDDYEELFKIANYLEDIDTEYIANYIAANTYKLKSIYNDLELLYDSPYTFQFIYTLNHVLENDPVDIVEKLEGKKCFNYLLKYNLFKSYKLKKENVKKL